MAAVFSTEGGWRPCSALRAGGGHVFLTEANSLKVAFHRPTRVVHRSPQSGGGAPGAAAVASGGGATFFGLGFSGLKIPLRLRPSLARLPQPVCERC